MILYYLIKRFVILQIGEEEIGQNEISITPSSYSDAGEYECIATNQEGTTSEKLEIEVHGTYQSIAQMMLTLSTTSQ